MTSRYLPAKDRLIRQQFDRVVQLADDFDAEATRCAEVGAFDAACLMVGWRCVNLTAREQLNPGGGH
jgi:hypothetical protein